MSFSNNDEIRFSFCSILGKDNEIRNTECEDVVCINETPTIRFFGLADGQTGKKQCRDGGKEVLKAVSQFINRTGIIQMNQYEHMDELQFELIKVIRDTISRMASAKGMEKNEFASTLVAFAFDIHSGAYVIIHLGDGGIIGQRKDGIISMLSPPENGLTSTYTWLTTSQDALYHLRIGFGSIRGYKRLMMITDGAMVYARGKNITEKAKEMISSSDIESIVSILGKSAPADDASCIIIDFG